MRVLSLSVAVTIVSAVLAAGQGSAVQPLPPVTFKMDINYVDVSVRVLDKDGHFVPNLTKDDFRILEDKKPQTIDAFGAVRLPFERPEKPIFLQQPLDPDVVVNARGNEGRLYVLVLDDLHTDALRSQRVRAAARKFISDHLSANDLAAVTVIGRSDAAQELTSNRRLLLAAVDKFIGQAPRSATLESVDAYNRGVASGMIDPGGDVSDPLLQERISNDRRSLRSLTRLADWMGSGVHGRRKALIYFSEGFGYDVSDVFRSMNSAIEPRKGDVLDLFDNMRDAISAATRNDVNIYAVDPRGLSAAGDVLIEAGGQADAGVAYNVDEPNYGAAGQFRPDLGAQSLNRELEAAHANLRQLSDETGGFATLNANEFTDAFNRIVDENGSYYVLGYYSKNEKRDGKYRAIDVRLVNRPGLVVRARKGYLAPRGGKPATAAIAADAAPDVPARLRDVLRSPVPVGGLVFSATAASFKGAASNNTVVVAVEVSGQDLGLVAKDGVFAGSLSLALVVSDPEGKLRASASPTLNLALKPDTYNYVSKNGSFRVVAQFALPPGRYVLRAAAIATGGKNSGGVQYDLDVPDFTKTRLALSNPVLMSAKASLSPTAADDHVDKTLPQPTTLREFSSDDELTLYVAAYDNQPTPAHTLDLVSTVQASDGTVVFKDEQARASTDVNARGVTTRIPLKGLNPGLYVLTVEARSRLSGIEPARQLVQFRVR
jgi:VWFA-related protein